METIMLFKSDFERIKTQGIYFRDMHDQEYVTIGSVHFTNCGYDKAEDQQNVEEQKSG